MRRSWWNGLTLGQFVALTGCSLFFVAQPECRTALGAVCCTTMHLPAPGPDSRPCLPRREEGLVEARSVDAALQALTLDKQEVDRHPEK